MNYTIDYFIDKFSKISEDEWTTHVLHNRLGQSCAMGLCGAKDGEKPGTAWYVLTAEAEQLRNLFKEYLNVLVENVNDGYEVSTSYPQSHPKARILAALHDVKKLMNNTAKIVPEVRERIVYVKVLETVDKELKEIEVVEN